MRRCGKFFQPAARCILKRGHKGKHRSGFEKTSVREAFLRAGENAGFRFFSVSKQQFVRAAKVANNPRKLSKTIDEMLDEAMAEAGFGPPVCVNAAPPKKRKKKPQNKKNAMDDHKDVLDSHRKKLR